MAYIESCLSLSYNYVMNSFADLCFTTYFMMKSTNSHFINFGFVAVIKCTPCCLLSAINECCDRFWPTHATNQGWQSAMAAHAHPSCSSTVEGLVDLIDTLDIFSRGRYSSCAVSVVDTLYVIGRTRVAMCRVELQTNYRQSQSQRRATVAFYSFKLPNWDAGKKVMRYGWL